MRFIPVNNAATVIAIVATLASEKVRATQITPAQSEFDAGYITSGINISHGPNRNIANIAQKSGELKSFLS